MRDLKHLIFFEDLLQNAFNPLIEQAKADGKVCIAYTCENVPEPLLNLDGTCSIRLTAPRTVSLDIATYYMTNLLCEPTRALLERAIEGGFSFADCIITPDGCTMMNRCVENMELLGALGKDNPNFFHEYMKIAFKNTENDVALAVLLGLFAVTFTVYFFNLDMKATSLLAPFLEKWYDRMEHKQYL